MKKFLIGFVALIVAVLVVAAIAPKDFKIEKSIVINKSNYEVFTYLRLMDNAQTWQPWSKMDPNMKKKLSGVDGTVGAVMSWSGNSEVGIGEEEITNVVENEKIDFELRFTEPMKATNTASLAIKSIGEDASQVTWTMTGRTPFPFNLICLMMHGKVEKNFEDGLKELKKILESQTSLLERKSKTGAANVDLSMKEVANDSEEKTVE